MSHNPLDQFKIKNIFDVPVDFIPGDYGLSFTNSSLFMVITIVTLGLFFLVATRKQMLVPNKAQLIAEGFYVFIKDMISGTVGEEGQKYFPIIFTVFLFILGCNLIGLFPYSFTVTSHIAVNLTISLILFIAITILGFVKHGFHFLRLFLPEGIPILIAPLIVVIEIFSYLLRPLTLAIRLTANMAAGHTMLKVIAGIILSLGLIGGAIPFMFLAALNGFEIFVALLQAYIFSMLTCIYLNDAINLH